jgi:hypothetical protein
MFVAVVSALNVCVTYATVNVVRIANTVWYNSFMSKPSSSSSRTVAKQPTNAYNGKPEKMTQKRSSAPVMKLHEVKIIDAKGREMYILSTQDKDISCNILLSSNQAYIPAKSAMKRSADINDITAGLFN